MANETFKFGGTKWAVKQNSILAYNDSNNNFKPLPFDFTRASTATRVNEDGLIEVVKSGIPRIDYTDNPSGHLLLEPSRTNLITYSEDFELYWGTSGASSSNNTTTSPSGENNGCTFSTSITAGTIQKSLTLSDGYYSFSIFAKKGSVNGIRLRIDADTDANGYFNLNTGEIHSATNEASIIDLGNGWYRCSISVNMTGFSKLNVYTTDGTTSYDIGNVYLYGAQLEEGSYATSYIPTSGTTETRVAETCTGAGNAQVFNDSEGVLFANVAALANDNTYKQISLSSSGLNFVIVRFKDAANTAQCVAFDGTTSFQQDGSLISTDFNKIAFKYKTSDFSFYLNGIKSTSTSAGDGDISSLSLNKMNFDNASGGGIFYGKIKQIGVYDTALTDEELETLTT